MIVGCAPPACACPSADRLHTTYIKCSSSILPTKHANRHEWNLAISVSFAGKIEFPYR